LAHEADYQLSLVESEVRRLEFLIRDIKDDATARGAWFSPHVQNQVTELTASITELEAIGAQYAADARSYHDQAGTFGVPC